MWLKFCIIMCMYRELIKFVFGFIIVGLGCYGAYRLGRHSAQAECECLMALQNERVQNALLITVFNSLAQRAFKPQSPTQRTGFEIKGFGRPL